MGKANIKIITKTALMAALVFLATYILKIPLLFGYTHLGDCMIFIGVIILGSKRGAFAGGVGAALADLAGGYPQWILPTFIIKFIMAFTMGIFIEKLMPKFKYNYIVGSVAGGIMQIIGYTAVQCFYYGRANAIVNIPPLLLQTVSGIVIAAIFVAILGASGILGKVKTM
ncbi:MAG: ECF transporter S component [Clostridia bacterium]|jgi:uncharacterized membrane protein|nr:ECF transporter S component [Clostridia bacterium]